MKLRKDKLNKMDRVPCNTDFIDKNTNTSQNMFETEYKNALNRIQEENRIEEAAIKRETIREEKASKRQFESVKWELYRQKVE